MQEVIPKKRAPISREVHPRSSLTAVPGPKMMESQGWKAGTGTLQTMASFGINALDFWGCTTGNRPPPAWKAHHLRFHLSEGRDIHLHTQLRLGKAGSGTGTGFFRGRTERVIVVRVGP